MGLAGYSPSVSRAALVCGILVIGRLIRRRFNPISILTLTLLLFSITDPSSILDIGLQLSYAATYSIIIGINSATKLIQHLKPNIFTKWLLELICVILLAQTAVLPIQIYYFWELGLLFLLANILVDPIIAPITIAGFASSILVIFGEYLLPLKPIFNCCIYGLDLLVSLPLDYMQNIANYLSEINNSSICIGPPPPSLIIFYYLSLILVISKGSNKKLLALYIALFATALTLLFQKTQHHPDWIFAYKNNLVISSNYHLFSTRKLSYSFKRCLKYNGINPSSVITQPLIDYRKAINLTSNYNHHNTAQQVLTPYKMEHFESNNNSKNKELAYLSTDKLLLVAKLEKGMIKPLHTTPNLILIAKRLKKSYKDKRIIIWTKNSPRKAPIWEVHPLTCSLPIPKNSKLSIPRSLSLFTLIVP